MRTAGSGKRKGPAEAGLNVQLLFMAATPFTCFRRLLCLVAGFGQQAGRGFANEQMFSECDVRAKLDEKRNVRALQSARFFRPNEFGCGNANDSVQRVKIGSGAVPSRDEANRAR
jgi:hypothetical protein